MTIITHSQGRTKPRPASKVFSTPSAAARRLIKVEWPVHRFTISEYERLVALDECCSAGHYELLDGVIVWNTDRTDMGQVQQATLLKTQLPLRRFSIAEYQQMISTGLLKKSDRLELIDGLILEMSPINPKHAECVDLLNELLVLAFYKQARVRQQSPISLEVRGSQPQPDFSLLSLRAGGYRDRHPDAEETFLVIEVSDSTLNNDRAEKLDLYAIAGIPEYWIANLIDNCFEVYREPYIAADGTGNYRTKLTFQRDQRLAPLAFPTCEIDLSQVLPTQGNK